MQLTSIGILLYYCRMQQLHRATIFSASALHGATEILETIPPVMRFIRTQMRHHRGSDLSVPQFRTLVFLDRNPGVSLSALAEFIGLSLPATSRLVEGLVRKALITRQIPAGNRRLVALSISARGRRTISSARSATVKRLAEVLVGLNDEERAAVQCALGALRREFQSAIGREVA